MSTVYITWWAWFIGSAILSRLNKHWYDNIIIVDHLDRSEKWKNLVWKKYFMYYDKKDFLEKIKNNEIINKNDIVIHMGACSSTIEKDSGYLMENNTKYSWYLYQRCKKVWARLIYASSAATYWKWEKWYDDNIFDLHPLNMYWYSKQLFDEWILKDTNNFKNLEIPQIVWLKFFNVYGPNEYHKWRMASVVFHWYNQIKQEGKIKLFKSYKIWIPHWEQKRDFIYIKDVVKIIKFFIDNPDKNWIFNVWTWKARSFNDLAKSVFNALWLKPNIEYIDMPDWLKQKYQYFTEAKIDKLRQIEYSENFFSLEDGVKDYVQNYLDKWYLVY